MPNKYSPGDTAFILESGRFIREVKIIKQAGDFCTLRFTDSSGGIKVRESRVFPTKEAAEASMPDKRGRYKSPWE